MRTVQKFEDEMIDVAREYDDGFDHYFDYLRFAEVRAKHPGVTRLQYNIAVRNLRKLELSLVGEEASGRHPYKRKPFTYRVVM